MRYHYYLIGVIKRLHMKKCIQQKLCQIFMTLESCLTARFLYILTS